ncbi:DUF2850 domain-containing protein [Thaumasiovibrio subtropicus]|uniref:DUF2850 domain-containing protein n=1 Tax=Thaumasiovibrio subtropicus TaxID=1891207 RepID=UPI000B3635B4|nr:DUF2850 domain-containing protein [Thaumasiovibrio subtropicus]
MKTNKRHLIQTILLFTFLAVSLFALGLLAMGAVKRGLFEPPPIDNIYGVWEEQEVPGYMADAFEIREDGIYVGGSIVTTRYNFNGVTLTYHVGQQLYLYTYSSQKLIRDKPAHYRSVFVRK